jgi:hypothetical protein
MQRQATANPALGGTRWHREAAGQNPAASGGDWRSEFKKYTKCRATRVRQARPIRSDTWGELRSLRAWLVPPPHSKRRADRFRQAIFMR